METRYNWDTAQNPRTSWACALLTMTGILCEMAAVFGILQALPETYEEIAASAFMIPVGFLFFGMAYIAHRVDQVLYCAKLITEAHPGDRGDIPTVPSEIA